MRKKGPSHKRPRRHQGTDLGELFYKQKGLCAYCKRAMVLGGNGPTSATRDHVVPRAHGGKQFRNIVAACGACKQAKAAQTVQKFRSTYRP